MRSFGDVVIRGDVDTDRSAHLHVPVLAVNRGTARSRLGLEQMVLQYVKKHGKITRKEVAELCRVSSDQAKRVLGRLHDAGRLTRCGEHRGVYYEIAPKT